MPKSGQRLSDPLGGRGGEFSLGERLRGDSGGLPEEKAQPNVPHGSERANAAPAPSPQSLPVVRDMRPESAIVEVEERFDEPAMEPVNPTSELWSAAAAEVLARRISELKGWEIVDNRRLVKTYLLPDFKQAVAFVLRIAAVAEELNHHPDVSLSTGNVRVTTTTHSAGGLTERDFVLAKRCDEVART